MSNSYQNILTEEKDGILYLTVNRPDKLNALTRKTIEEIGNVFSAEALSTTVHVVIITGQGSKAFGAGADISEFASFTKEEATALSRFGQEVFTSIEQFSKPVIAAVNGYALGGGCELALACHVRIASTNAVFGLPEVSLGLLPGYGGTQRLPLIVGKGRAMEMLLSGAPKDSAWALSSGLANHVVEQEQLLVEATKLAHVIASRAPIALSKVIDVTQNPLPDFALEANAFGDCFSTKDFKEGTSAFLEKRKPTFKGA
jgi:enoyl-CoA hydratase